MMDGKTVWQGAVEIFGLTGHPTATKAFAWAYRDALGEIQSMAVLNAPPISSPREAVQAAIASGQMRTGEEERGLHLAKSAQTAQVLDMCQRFNREFTLSEIVARVVDERAELVVEFSEIWGVLIMSKNVRVFTSGEPATYVCQ
ncbi:MAG: hypothetical protein ACAH88_12435 [Roseimicrobium sp.]